MVSLQEIDIDNFSFDDPVKLSLVLFLIALVTYLLHFCYLKAKGAKVHFIVWFVYMILSCIVISLSMYLFVNFPSVSLIGVSLEILVCLIVFLLGGLIYKIGNKKSIISLGGSDDSYSIKICRNDLKQNPDISKNTNEEVIFLTDDEGAVLFIAKVIQNFFKDSKRKSNSSSKKLSIDASLSNLPNDKLVKSYELALNEGWVSKGCSVELKNKEFNIVLESEV